MEPKYTIIEKKHTYEIHWKAYTECISNPITEQGAYYIIDSKHNDLINLCEQYSNIQKLEEKAKKYFIHIKQGCIAYNTGINKKIYELANQEIAEMGCILYNLHPYFQQGKPSLSPQTVNDLPVFIIDYLYNAIQKFYMNYFCETLETLCKKENISLSSPIPNSERRSFFSIERKTTVLHMYDRETFNKYADNTRKNKYMHYFKEISKQINKHIESEKTFYTNLLLPLRCISADIKSDDNGNRPDYENIQKSISKDFQNNIEVLLEEWIWRHFTNTQQKFHGNNYNIYFPELQTIQTYIEDFTTLVSNPSNVSLAEVPYTLRFKTFMFQHVSLNSQELNGFFQIPYLVRDQLITQYQFYEQEQSENILYISPHKRKQRHAMDIIKDDDPESTIKYLQYNQINHPFQKSNIMTFNTFQQLILWELSTLSNSKLKIIQCGEKDCKRLFVSNNKKYCSICRKKRKKTNSPQKEYQNKIYNTPGLKEYQTIYNRLSPKKNDKNYEYKKQIRDKWCNAVKEKKRHLTLLIHSGNSYEKETDSFIKFINEKLDEILQSSNHDEL